MSNTANTSSGLLAHKAITAATVTGTTGLLRRSTDPLPTVDANPYLVRSTIDGMVTGAPCLDKCVA